MTAYHRQKGSSFERLIADYLKANGFPFADRRVKTGPSLPEYFLLQPTALGARDSCRKYATGAPRAMQKRASSDG